MVETPPSERLQDRQACHPRPTLGLIRANVCKERLSNMVSPCRGITVGPAVYVSVVLAASGEGVRECSVAVKLSAS